MKVMRKSVQFHKKDKLLHIAILPVRYEPHFALNVPILACLFFSQKSAIVNFAIQNSEKKNVVG